MKRIWVFILLLTSSIALYSQSPLNVGIKFGTNSSSLFSDYNDFFDESEVNNYFVGAFFKANIGNIYLQPEAYFNTKKGGRIESLVDLNEFDLNYQTIDIPLLIGFHIYNKPNFNLRVYGGPVLSYITTEPLIDDINNFDINELKDNYIGIQAGVGVDLWFITLDARIENSFNIFIDDSQYQAANRVYLLSAGIKIF